MSLQSPQHATDAEISGLFRIIDDAAPKPAPCLSSCQPITNTATRDAFARLARAAAAVIQRGAVLALVLAIGITQHVHAADVEALVMYEHRSNLFDGPPFNRNPESTEDFVCAGASIRWRTVELDACHGIVSRDCNYLRTSITAAPCEWQQGTKVSTRWYPGRKRRGLR